ncbi:DinB family protein [bacterium]|nr:DinB family protein [bacterium]
MSMLPMLKRLLHHDMWANHRAIEMSRALPEESERCRKLMAHILTSKKMWLGRIHDTQDGKLDSWPDLSWQQVDDLLAEMNVAVPAYLDSLSEDDLSRVISYVNPRGMNISVRLGDIITHSMLHGQYHRAQIATSVREAGGEPVMTDFIVMAIGELKAEQVG